ncbi:MAG: 50S ribosomal protein L11 methyltransferase [Dysgonamonadaceae bacterium]
MNNYIEVKFIFEPYDEAAKDVLAALAADIGFESFVDAEDGTVAYIPVNLFDESSLQQLISCFPLENNIRYTSQEIEGKDWNEEWEKNYFQPLIIDEQCIVQSSFHHAPKIYKYNITIDPKMAFGTGHHQTTELMIRSVLEENFEGKSLLDMGCGTAILAILASMKGADPVTAIDIDQWAYDNAMENLQLNHVANVEVKIGGAELLGSKTFDVILANINRNILLNDINRYVSVLNPNGLLFMSGFYREDIAAIEAACKACQLELVSCKEKDNWVAVKFRKN